MKKIIFGIVAIGALVVIVLVLRNAGEGTAPDGNGAPQPAGAVQTFDLNTYTDPTANFIAELVNLLIEKTR